MGREGDAVQVRETKSGGKTLLTFIMAKKYTQRKVLCSFLLTFAASLNRNI